MIPNLTLKIVVAAIILLKQMWHL